MDKTVLNTIPYWGAATAAHQVEGRTHNQWSVWELAHASELAERAQKDLPHWLPAWEDVKTEAVSAQNYVSSAAADHYNRFEEDFDLLEQLNMNSFRMSVEWSRLEPVKGEFSDAEFEHYRDVLRSLKRRRITPFVTLWHFTNPLWFEQLGGWQKRENISHFVQFAEKVAVELGEFLEFVITVNEPNIYASLSYGTGVWPPNERSWLKSLKIYRNLITAHNRSAPVIKAVLKDVKVGLSQNVSHIRRANRHPLAYFMAWLQRTVWNEYALDRTDGQADFIGLNFYFSDRWDGGFGPHNEADKTSDMGFSMRPADIEPVLRRLHERYGKPIIVTENGVADRADRYRKWWIWETLAAISRAVGDGVDVQGYLHWSLLDNFEWDKGFWPRFGLIEVERQTLRRTIRPSGEWFGRLIGQIRGNKGPSRDMIEKNKAVEV